MSAPTALETGAIARGLAWNVDPTPARVVTVVDERRNQHPIAQLGRRYDRLCREACDPLEIAAVLEAAGVNDSAARSGHQVSDVFEVAEVLWGLVPFRWSAETTWQDTWRLSGWRAAARGLLYVLPALVYIAALLGVPRGAALIVLIIAGITSISLGQGLSVLGHLMVARGLDAVLARLLRVSLAGAAAMGLLTMVLVHAVGGGLDTGFVATGQLVYMAAATILMVRARELLLLSIVAPGAVIATLLRFGVVGSVKPLAVGLFLGALVVGVVALSLWQTGRRRGARRARVYRLSEAIGAEELRAALDASVYGAGLALLASFVLLDAVAGRIHVSGVHIAAVMLPVTATLGAGDFLLHRARSRASAALSTGGRIAGFARVSRTELNAMVAIHSAGVAMLAAVIVAVFQSRQSVALVAAHTLTYALLSVSLLVLTTLLSLGYFRVAAQLIISAAALDVVARLVIRTGESSLAFVHLGIVLALLGVAYLVAASRFESPSVHA